MNTKTRNLIVKILFNVLVALLYVPFVILLLEIFWWGEFPFIDWYNTLVPATFACITVFYLMREKHVTIARAAFWTGLILGGIWAEHILDAPDLLYRMAGVRIHGPYAGKMEVLVFVFGMAYTFALAMTASHAFRFICATAAWLWSGPDRWDGWLRGWTAPKAPPPPSAADVVKPENGPVVEMRDES